MLYRKMPTLCALAFVVFTSALPFSLAEAAQANKCTINGTVTYQTDPCPSGQARRAPTVEQLNAERQKKLRQSGDSQAPGARSPSGSTTLGEKGRPSSAATPPAPPATVARCDGRVHCSQMRSCTEAKYFLANCPGVKMDGDRDGIPCEQQWCQP
jgi:hypothetical protein